MSWFVKEGGYELFFNRDERISRRRAELPSVQKTDSVTYISPTDADAGGSWIAANHFGVTVCLLNHYQYEQIATYKRWVSRGEIVRQLAATPDLTSAERQFNTLAFDDFRAFRMFVIDRTGGNRLCVWDGHTPRIERNVATPKSSSSVDAMHVKTVRRKLFFEQGLPQSRQSSQFVRYHASHLPMKSKESVCMHREDASTVSLSHVDVNASRVKFSYADGAPCTAKLGDPLRIPVIASADSPSQPGKIAMAASI